MNLKISDDKPEISDDASELQMMNLNFNYWIWMASATETSNDQSEQLRYCILASGSLSTPQIFGMNILFKFETLTVLDVTKVESYNVGFCI